MSNLSSLRVVLSIHPNLEIRQIPTYSTQVARQAIIRSAILKGGGILGDIAGSRR